MKRDMNLIRLLLFEQEGQPKNDFSDYSEDQIVYHSALLIDAGLLRGAVLRNKDGEATGTIVISLTWAGHDFLDMARNGDAWNKTKQITKEKGLSLSFDLFKELLTSVVRQQIGL